MWSLDSLLQFSSYWKTASPLPSHTSVRHHRDRHPVGFRCILVLKQGPEIKEGDKGDLCASEGGLWPALWSKSFMYSWKISGYCLQNGFSCWWQKLYSVECCSHPLNSHTHVFFPRGRLLHGRHFTYKSITGDTAITFVSTGVEGAFATEEHPYAAHGPWLQVREPPSFFSPFILYRVIKMILLRSCVV